MSSAAAVVALALSSLSGGEYWDEPRERPAHAARPATESDDCRASYGLALAPVLALNAGALAVAGIGVGGMHGGVGLLLPLGAAVVGPIVSTSLVHMTLHARCPQYEWSDKDAILAGIGVTFASELIGVALSTAGAMFAPVSFLTLLPMGAGVVAAAFIAPAFEVKLLDASRRPRAARPAAPQPPPREMEEDDDEEYFSLSVGAAPIRQGAAAVLALRW